MREVKFRAKDIQGKWHYGYLTSDNNVDYDIYVTEEKECHRVMEDTIGQYTGLKDINNKEIYEGDVIEWSTCDQIDDDEIIDYKTGLCMWQEYGFVIKVGCYEFHYLDELQIDITILGNKYDNPKLFKEG